MIYDIVGGKVCSCVLSFPISNCKITGKKAVLSLIIYGMFTNRNGT